MRRRKIAQRLADPGPCLRQQQVRHAALWTWGKHAARFARITSLAIALLGAFASQPSEPCFDFFFLDQNVAGGGALGCFLPFRQAREQPPFGLVWLADVSVENLRPRPAQPHKRLQYRPRAFAFGPVVATAGFEQPASGGLQERRHRVVARRLVDPERVREALGCRHREPSRMHEREQFEQVEPGQVGIAEAARYQRRIQQQQRRVGSSHHRLALAATTRGLAVAQPGAGVACVKGGKGQRRAHFATHAKGGTKSKHTPFLHPPVSGIRVR